MELECSFADLFSSTTALSSTSTSPSVSLVLVVFIATLVSLCLMKNVDLTFASLKAVHVTIEITKSSLEIQKLVVFDCCGFMLVVGLVVKEEALYK